MYYLINSASGSILESSNSIETFFGSIAEIYGVYPDCESFEVIDDTCTVVLEF